MANADQSGQERKKGAAKDAAPSSSDRLHLEVSILASDSEDAAATAADEPGTDGGSRKRVVLVVAPDRDMRTYVRRCLRLHREIHVVEAGDDKGAIRAARITRPEVVIVDVDGPDPSSAGRGRALRAEAAMARLPMIVISDDEPDGELAELVGGALPGVIIVKPFNARQLCKEVELLLSLKPPEEFDREP